MPRAFFLLIENLMDMYHGSLHAQYQVWTAEALQEVLQSENQVTATYQATTYYRVKDLWSILHLFIPPLRKLHAAPLTVTYDYPNWKSTLGEDFKIFCLICPVNERLTDAYLIHYTSIGKFKALNDLPLPVVACAALSSPSQHCGQLRPEDVMMIEEKQPSRNRGPPLR